MSSLAFSHFGFFVTDIDRVAHFYKTALRFTQTDEGRLGELRLIFLSRDPAEHHQIVLVSGRPSEPTFGLINQISFRVDALETLRKTRRRLVDAGAGDVQAVTHGNAISLYCRDPEGNRIEVFLDTPWYCEQPLRVPVDLDQDDDQVLAQARAIAADSPRFMPRAVWQAAVAQRMAADQAEEP